LMRDIQKSSFLQCPRIRRLSLPCVHLLQNKQGAVALANIFCWAAALLYAQMGAK